MALQSDLSTPISLLALALSQKFPKTNLIEAKKC
jgi:hypothetical protein